MRPRVEPDACWQTVKRLPGIAWLAAVAAVLVLAACASTPQASREADLEAKEFNTHPNASAIYVFRSEFNRHTDHNVLFMDGRLIGATLPGTFFRIDAVPGQHVFHGTGADVGRITLDTTAGELYFVSLNVVAGHSRFEVVPPAVGKERVRACCAMLERWAPGQRPFFR
jgi:hypothetical protein